MHDAVVGNMINGGSEQGSSGNTTTAEEGLSGNDTGTTVS